MAAPTAGLSAPPAQARGGGRQGIPVMWLFEALLVGLAVAYLALFVGTGLLRVAYAFPLDATEVPALTEVQRVLRGEPLYVAPTLEYVPLIYGPVYFYLV